MAGFLTRPWAALTPTSVMKTAFSVNLSRDLAMVVIRLVRTDTSRAIPSSWVLASSLASSSYKYTGCNRLNVS